MYCFNNSTNNFDFYDQESKVECYKLKYIGIYGVILFVLCVSSNFIYIWVYVTNKCLQVPVNILVVTLAILSLIGTFLEFPFVLYSAFNCKFVFGKVGCYLSGFVMYFIGCMNIYLLIVISIERYLVNYRFTVKKKITNMICYKIIAVCGLISLFWSSAPFFGWSHYSLEGAMISCSVEWHEREPTVISYNVAIFLFVFLIPFVMLVAFNVKLIKIIRLRGSIHGSSIFAHLEGKKRQVQRDITVFVTFLIASFILSWLPYGIVSMIRVFSDSYQISPLMATIPSLFAKTFLLWPSLLTILTSITIKRILFKRLSNIRRKRVSISFESAGSQSFNNDIVLT